MDAFCLRIYTFSRICLLKGLEENYNFYYHSMTEFIEKRIKVTVYGKYMLEIPGVEGPFPLLDITYQWLDVFYKNS